MSRELHATQLRRVWTSRWGVHNMLCMVTQSVACAQYIVWIVVQPAPKLPQLCNAGEQMDRIAAFGLVVREARLAEDLTQETLAEKANLHRNFVSLIERGQSKIALDSLFALADALELTASELLRRAELVAAQ